MDALKTIREVADVWARWKYGEVVPCPKSDGALALAVEGTSKAYRLICTTCGTSTPWFQANGDSLVLHGGGEPDE
jgi:hypothetical protein